MNKKMKLKNYKIQINFVFIIEVSNKVIFSMGEYVYVLFQFVFIVVGYCVIGIINICM